jgi:hypothetical protein
MKKVIYTLAFLLIAGTLAPLTSDAQDKGKLGKLMVAKLRSAQSLLEGLATRNFTKITRSAEELIQLSKAAEWYVFHTPRFEMHTNEFRRAAETIVQKSQEKNIDGVALAYVDMTLTCVRCHDYVREVREVRLPATRPAFAGLLGCSERLGPR